MTPEEQKKHLEEAVDYVFNQSPEKDTERKIKFMSYCSGIGRAKWYGGDSMDLCGDPECRTCRGFEGVFKQEVEKGTITAFGYIEE